MPDLVVLVADKNMEAAIKGLFSRPQALRTRSFSHDLYVHPQHDPGCFLQAQVFLRQFVPSHTHALVIFDRHGCGQDRLSRRTLEQRVERHLGSAGWRQRAAAITIDPELENWVWSDSPHVEATLGWVGREPDLQTWLTEQGFLHIAQLKPGQPKEAMEAALKAVRLPRSSSLYLQLASQVNLERCTDSAFLKFRATLQNWFPE